MDRGSPRIEVVNPMGQHGKNDNQWRRGSKEGTTTEGETERRVRQKLGTREQKEN